ncbi:MAG: phosphoglucosamine mutase [Alphaproteobacteria bacterium]|nr:phosphoglucosamine mutase [Alphaproteobacteria bacterium]
MAERKLFGTDGIRGKSNTYPMTAEMALKVGIAAGSIFKTNKNHNQVIIGKDTRLSGYMLENALAAGFTAVGMNVIFVGPLPTPAVAMLTRHMRVDLGVMISASHNPFDDNGIKLFAPDGYKLSDDTEAQIEAYMEKDLSALLTGAEDIGQVSRLESGRGRYIEYVKSSFPKDLRLTGRKIVIDCANGAAYRTAPSILWELGAEVVPLFVNPTGRNINEDCGALHVERMCEEVVKQKADIGIAVDGDADRVIICDENGKVVDGDQIIAMIALEWSRLGILKGNAAVATIMSNLGLELFLKEKGLDLIRTKVGDRYVVEAMRKNGYNLGGEQSGHIILGEHSTTGDGMMAALQVLAVMQRMNKKASEVTSMFTPLPQMLKNVRLESRDKAKEVLEIGAVKDAIVTAEKALGGKGRIVIRTSGTEPLIRVMAEGQDKAEIEALIDTICETISKAA